MPCFHPISGYRSRSVNATGKRSIVFNTNDGYKDLPVELPCGRCTGCRLERSRQWAIRCVHEAQLYEDNCFLTLTYDNEHLPETGSLVKKHHQDFLKRLRFKYRHKKIRYYHCGEYGDLNSRPHYHTLLFNHDFDDKLFYTERDGTKLYTSQTLESLWQKGFCTIGAVTFDSAAYVARYVMKKVNGNQAESHYQAINPATGELTPIIPEYTTMSRRPGIGTEWYKKYKSDVYPYDYLVVNGKKMKPPRYYDLKLESEDVQLYEKLKNERRELSRKDAENQTRDRLLVREKVLKSRLKSKKREI